MRGKLGAKSRRVHIFYAMVFLSLAAAAGQAIDASLNAPDFGDFHRRILAGEVTRSYSARRFT
jgi:hypothetical protein